MNQQELNQKRKVVEIEWLKWSEMRNNLEGKPDKIPEYEEAKQKCNLCYVFLHALEYCGAESHFDCDFSPFSYNQKWTEVLELP